MRSFTSLFVFKIYFKIWRSRWDLKDTSPAYHWNYQHLIHELEIQPKTLWRASLTNSVGFFAATLHYAAIMNGFYLFILKSLSLYFTLSDYNFTGCFWFPDLVSSERDRLLWMRQLCIICCKAKSRFVSTLLKINLVRGRTSGVPQTKKWIISANKEKASIL